MAYILIALIVVIVLDYTLLGLLAFFITGNRNTDRQGYCFRCAGSTVTNSTKGLIYFSGSLVKVCISDKGIVLGKTFLSHHKSYENIRLTSITNYVLWKALNIETKNGDNVKIFCKSKHARTIKKIFI